MEALIALMGWAFMHDELQSIPTHTHADNLPSRKLLVNCGFNELGKDADNLCVYKVAMKRKK
jgi:RimJ/RimL family protein N-acetyltransferase